MQPKTPTSIPGLFCFSFLNSVNLLLTVCSAFSRIEQVFNKTRSASSKFRVAPNPSRLRSRPRSRYPRNSSGNHSFQYKIAYGIAQGRRHQAQPPLPGDFHHVSYFQQDQAWSKNYLLILLEGKDSQKGPVCDRVLGDKKEPRLLRSIWIKGNGEETPNTVTCGGHIERKTASRTPTLAVGTETGKAASRPSYEYLIMNFIIFLYLNFSVCSQG